MDITSLFYFARNDSIKNFMPLTQIKTESDKTASSEAGYCINYTVHEFKNDFPTIDATKVFFCNGIYKMYYFDREKHVLFSIPLYGRDVGLTSEFLVEKITGTINDLTSTAKNREYRGPIMAVSDRMRMEYFNMLIDDGIVDGLLDYFIEAYTSSDYGCEAISYENMVKLFNSRSRESKDRMVEEKNKALKMHPDILTVYRGEASKSTPHNISWSWTLDINMANFFATRFGDDDSKIVKGVVKKEDIEVYFVSEHECIINPIHVDVVKVIVLYGQSWFTKMMQTHTLHLYHKYRDILIEKYETNHVTELHSPLHSARVLCLALLLGRLHKLSHKEMNNLATAIVYHDLGRIDDSVDDLHGKRGAEIFLSNKVSRGIDKKTISFLIEYHCLDDNVGYEFIKNNFDDCERVLLLYNIIKDADALDRVRFGKYGLNMSYLRLSESRKMTLIARLCVNGIQI